MLKTKKLRCILLICISFIQNSYASKEEHDEFNNLMYHPKVAKDIGFYHNNQNGTFNETYLENFISKISKKNKDLTQKIRLASARYHLAEEIALRKIILEQKYNTQYDACRADKNTALHEMQITNLPWQNAAQPWKLLFGQPTISPEERYTAATAAKNKMLLAKLITLKPTTNQYQLTTACTQICDNFKLAQTEEPTKKLKDALQKADFNLGVEIQYEAAIKERRLNQAIVAGYTTAALAGLGYWWLKSQK